MAPSHLQHRRTHNLLLISKLLAQRDAASPFTLVLDSLEQAARPLIAEYIKRAKAANVQIIFVSFETLRKPRDVDSFICAWNQPGPSWQKEVANTIRSQPTQRKLLILDSLNPLSTTHSQDLPALLSSFIGPGTSLVAVYHADIPISPSITHRDPYSPAPLTLLNYLATTIFTVHCLQHVVARKKARDRSLVEPSFGLDQGVEGLMQGLGANGGEGLVLEMEHRRKSGRGVREWYILPLGTRASSNRLGPLSKEKFMLLEDHPDYRSPEPEATADAEEGGPEATTFELGLTEKQRRDREGVVLPYHDAQKGGVEGGRILYDMGSEDDFDEEEDEI